MRACPTATELPSMLWDVAIKRPTEGSILRAGKGGWGGTSRRGRPEAGVPKAESPDPAHSVGPIIDGSLQAF